MAAKEWPAGTVPLITALPEAPSPIEGSANLLDKRHTAAESDPRALPHDSGMTTANRLPHFAGGGKRLNAAIALLAADADVRRALFLAAHAPRRAAAESASAAWPRGSESEQEDLFAPLDRYFAVATEGF